VDLVRDVGGLPLAVVSRPYLPAALADELHAATLDELRWLVDASTGGRDSYRQAQLLYTPPDEAAPVVARIAGEAARWCQALGLPPFEPRRVEAQVTVHGDGDFYRPHTDDQGEEAARRVLSYVLHFHRQPRRFSGGELRLGGEVIASEHNLLVVFPSRLEHEVLPISLASGDIGDGRFTLNGWLWR
jgi:Rps23 Pro-64 3,4-dihydroxylase Tpa1-like proline 4-hydroxylase